MNGDICRRMNCSICCHGTEMELIDEDVQRISSRGYSDFYHIDDGSKILNNIDGKCIFLEGNDCIINDDKPRGCRLYPLIMSMPSRTPTMDEDCPHRHLFSFDPDEILELERLIDILEEEE